jgi:hypothetical protein
VPPKDLRFRYPNCHGEMTDFLASW